MRLRDFSRLGRNKFLEKMLRGAEPFGHDPFEWHAVPYAPIEGAPFRFSDNSIPISTPLWGLSRKMAFERIQALAIFAAKSSQGGDHQIPLDCNLSKSKAELLGFAAMTPKDQRKLCARWRSEAKSADPHRSNSRVSVPQLTA